MATNRPPPKVLFIHNGASVDAHIQYVTEAGLDVADVHADIALAKAVEFQPDIIVLDFTADGDVTAQLKRDDATKHIPIIALAELSKTHDERN